MDGDSKTWQQGIGIALGLAVLGLAGGYMGFLHPFGDSLSVGRGIASAAVLLLAVFASFAGLRMAAFVSMLLAMLTGGQVLLAYSWPGLSGSYSVYQKNMLYRNATLDLLEADIRGTDPQIVALQEVSAANEALLANLKDAYPHQHLCPGRTVGGTAILTRLAPVEGTAFCGPGMAAIQLSHKEDRFWVVSVHMEWPWPHEQAVHVDLLLPILNRLEGPAILAGDFNMVRWANSVTRMAGILGVRPANPTHGTFIGLSRLVPLPIDHVFSTGGGKVSLRGAAGSDHKGLLAQVEI